MWCAAQRIFIFTNICFHFKSSYLLTLSGRDLIIDMFLNRPHYLNAIQTMCPHILRYLATAVIINRSKRNALKDLVKVIQQVNVKFIQNLDSSVLLFLQSHGYLCTTLYMLFLSQEAGLLSWEISSTQPVFYVDFSTIADRTPKYPHLFSLYHFPQESYTYKDPITEFLEHLYVSFDFESAREKLTECTEVLDNDFFLVACLDEFVENARLMIFETFCRIHQCISIQ